MTVQENGKTPAAALLMNLRETARALRMSERAAWTLAKRGELPVVRIGRMLRFDPADLRTFIDQHKPGPRPGRQGPPELS
jgi:predicted DNA-binding transcriptional regulator AlpA